MHTTTSDHQVASTASDSQPAAKSLVSHRSRFASVDALRGLACLWVLFHHSVPEYHAIPGLAGIPFKVLAMIVQSGWLGVSMFLVLSGFCLYYPLVRRAPNQPPKVEFLPFMKRRCLRLLPAYWATLALCVALGVATGFWGRDGLPAIDMIDVFTHTLLIHNLHPATIRTINGALWSLALEFQLYLIFPLFVIIVRKAGLRVLLPLTLGVSLVWQYYVFCTYGWSLEWTVFLSANYHALPGRCFEFALGMAAAALVAQPRPRLRAIALRMLVVLVPPALWVILYRARFGVGLDQIWGLIFAALLIVIVGRPQRERPSSRPGAWLVWLGTISYSVYLIHQPLANFLTSDRLGLAINDPFADTLLGLGRIGVSIVLGYGFFLMVERRSLALSARPASAPA